MVLLVTSDEERFNADKDVVERSVLIKNMLEGECQPQPWWVSSPTTVFTPQMLVNQINLSLYQMFRQVY